MNSESESESESSSQEIEESKLNSRLYEWTNLSGWITSYLNKPGKAKIKSNSEAFEKVSNLLKIPKPFYKPIDPSITTTKTLYYIKSNQVNLNSSFDLNLIKLEKDFKELIYFIGLNSKFKIKEVYFDSKKIKLIEFKKHDWVLFSLLNLIEFIKLSSSSSSSFDLLNDDLSLKEIYQMNFKFLRNLNQSIGLKIGVLGFWKNELDGLDKLKWNSIENVRLIEIWKKDYLITFTSQSTTSNPMKFQQFLQKLKESEFNSIDSNQFLNWLHLFTFHQLIPTSNLTQSLLTSSSTHPSSSSNSIERYFSKLNSIQIISKSLAWPKYLIGDTFLIQNHSKALSDHLIKHPGDYFPNRLNFEEMCKLSKKIDEGLIELPRDEMKSLIRFSSLISDSIWNLKNTILIVSEEEKLNSNEFDQFSCQIMSFDEVFELMDKEEDE
ncbi:hypothetical protein DFH28DRAFT_169429 [Melampsora americana]|nr:hypothetical protein DFH28DRAFT_169429 [Melampsora americana]